MATYIIAEAGVNHNGSLQMAKKLCDAAKWTGANAIKFQTWKTEKIITQTVAQADYQKDNTGKQESQFEMLKRLELSYDNFREIKAYCDEIKIDFMSTADEEESLKFIVSLGVPYLKVGSGEIGNIPYLRKIAGYRLPIILSTGMSTLADISISLDELKKNGAKDIYLLHCTTSYPCVYQDVNLRAMDTLAQAFHLPVGYSDHTIGIEVSVAAVARGAQVIEKHFTLDKNMEGPDHLASTEPKEFKQMVESIRNIEIALGKSQKEPSQQEKEISKVVLKRIVAKKPIPVGKVIEEEDICTKRNNQGILAKYWELVVGTKASKAYEPDEGIMF